MQGSYSVYMHIFPNGKKYIGITCQHPIKKRWTSTGIGYKKCPKMWQAIQKYGWDNVEHIVLYENLSKEMAEDKEIQLIKEHDSIKNGYNIENGGNVQGTHSEETKCKISESNKGRIVSETTREKMRAREKLIGDKNPFYGRHHSEKTKTEHAAFMMGNQYNKGNHHTDAFKQWKSAQMSKKYSEGGNPRCKRVVMSKPNGAEEVFYSLRKAAEVVGISPAALCKYIQKGIVVNGCKWRYENA